MFAIKALKKGDIVARDEVDRYAEWILRVCRLVYMKGFGVYSLDMKYVHTKATPLKSLK